MYFLLEPDGELRYIGKATSLRSRIGAHRRAGTLAGDTRVLWEEHLSAMDAEARESDLIVFLKPLGNRSHVAQDPNHFVRIPPCAGSYGTFPHLANGTHTAVAKRTRAGLAALRRVVADGGVDQHSLHDLMSGRSDRLLEADPPRLDPIRALARGREIGTIRDFYRFGPQRLRALRLRHGLRPGPVSAEIVRRCLVDEISELLGEFHVPPPDDDLAIVVGRRRAASMRRGLR